jgi:non-specific serine/threonine protein kinase/serine/threonine-protein kinase
MEYIEGRPITAYCEQRSLTTFERLRLFRMVCSAVQYAHQNLVVHRDLKPGNILVTSDGVPKLLDFGIAKLLEPYRDATVASMRLLTPECASPEQVRGEPITTASDVYALGVLLYQILTGQTPYEFKTRTAEEIRRVVCEEEPRKPSSVRPIPADLDSIVLKALQKDPAHRYASALQLSDDIERHLAGLPVLARTGTFVYRTSKFISRHKAATVAATLVIVSLMGGMGATLWEAHIARIERTREERRFNDVRKLANSLMLDIHDAIQDLPGSLAARKLLVDRALQYLDSLAQESGGDPNLQRELAVAYEKVGAAQGGVTEASLGDSTGALSSYKKALAIRQTLVSSKAATIEDRVALARSLTITGRLARDRGDLAAALDFTRRGVLMLEALRAEAPDDPRVLNQLQTSYDALGGTLSSTGASGSLGLEAEAAEIHRKGVELGRAQVARHPNDAMLKRRLGVALIKVSNDCKKDGQRREALAYAIECRDIFAALASANPTSATFRRLLAGCYSSMGDIQIWDGDAPASFKSYREAFATTRVLLEAEPRSQQAQFDVVSCRTGLGYSELRLGRAREAHGDLESASRIAENAARNDQHNALAKQLWAYSETGLGDLYGRNRAPARALASYRKALSLWEPLATATPEDVDTRLCAASVGNRIGLVLTGMGLEEEAQAAYRIALARAEASARARPPNQWALYVVADAYSGLGDVAARLAEKQPDSAEATKQWTAARSWYERSAAAWSQVHNPGVMNPGTFECGSPARVAAAIRRCDASLRRFAPVARK